MRRIVRLKGIKVVTKKDGRRYLYRRVGGLLVSLPDLPENHPEFIEAYNAAGKVKPSPHFKKGTIAALIVDFKGSREFKARKTSTRRVWQRRLDAMSAAYGSGMVMDLRPEHIRRALRKLTPGAARSERTIWRAVLSYAVDEEWRPDNPALGVKTEKYESSPHVPWSLSDVRAFRDRWPIGSAERQAMEVIYWTGARCIDAAALGWQLVTDGVLEFEQEKTGGIAVVPITTPVDGFLEADRAIFLECLPKNLTWILTRTGKPRSVKGLSQFVSAAARNAGLNDRTAHGLRKSRATILANNGWTPHRIGAWTGHESLAEIAHYTRSVNKRNLVSRTEQDQNSGNSPRTVSINREKGN
ncbi:tyrosine-type recombinase/integrase [Shimia sp.]|uniref:tyrosine-type recombinase/integrase n=1 Tax=Shimia sp. TaxID=1954381 RepID=UPI003B8AB83E